MAKAAKSRSKTQTRTARQGSAPKTSVKRKARPSSRKRREESRPETWLGLATTLVSSAVGRAIVAEVLAATAEILRKHRADGPATVEQRLNPEAAGGLAAEPMSEVLARSAAGALAEVASDAIHRMRTEPSARDDEGTRR
jgi:hypothetical protein